MTYLVKLDKWATPTTIEAIGKREAALEAVISFPVCDCGCNELTHVEWVKQND